MVQIQGKSRRTDPSLARSAMLNAVIGILGDLQGKSLDELTLLFTEKLKS